MSQYLKLRTIKKLTGSSVRTLISLEFLPVKESLCDTHLAWRTFAERLTLGPVNNRSSPSCTCLCSFANSFLYEEVKNSVERCFFFCCNTNKSIFLFLFTVKGWFSDQNENFVRRVIGRRMMSGSFVYISCTVNFACEMQYLRHVSMTMALQIPLQC